MCRLLLVENPLRFSPAPHLEAFKALSKASKEYQGHGWGCAWLDHDRHWQFHHNIQPIWEDRKSFPDTSLFLAHARSAFRDEGVVVENNMPFFDDTKVFLFNGELRGVKVKAEGRIGAEKIFNTIRRFDKGDLCEATHRAVKLINHRTRYIRAMNFFMADKHQIQVCSQFAENPDYFQLRSTVVAGTRIICSQSYDVSAGNWQKVENNRVQTILLH